MSELLEIRSIEGYVAAKAKYEGEFFNAGVAKKVRRFWGLYRKALWCSNHIERCYHKVYLYKADGGYRTINIPNSEMKTHQRFIVEMLHEIQVSKYAYAYRKGRSGKQMAQIHHDAGKQILLKLDIKDFYGSIKFSDVYKIFREESEADKALCTFLSNLCCLDGTIPQGAPTSPVISNIVFRHLDEVIGAYSEKYGITYTRYSDDMMFSFNTEDILPKEVISFVRYLLRDYGFRLNEQKTKVIRRGGRYSVLGVNIGDRQKLQVSKKYRRSIRQEMYYIGKFGLKEHISCKKGEDGLFNGKTNEFSLKTCIDYLTSLLGRIQYVIYIDPLDAEAHGYMSEVKALLNEYRHQMDEIRLKNIPKAFLEISDEDIPF